MENKKTIQIPEEYRRLFDDDWREAAIYGGRYSMKSHTVARFLLIMARQRQMRVACFREFQNSIADSSYQLLSDLIKKYELTDFTLTNNSIVNAINGSDFLFKGLWNNEQSIKSIEGIDIAWVEEAQTVSQASIEILTPTVRKPGSKIIYTYNRLMEDDPVHTRLVLEGRPNTLIINTNYDIAIKYGMMPDVILREIEDDKEKRPKLYKHKWLGAPNNLEQRIFKDWAIIDDIPHEARLERRGLDFGFTNDPTVIVDIYYYNGGYIIDELVYQKGLSNKSIADLILATERPDVLTVADSAEPKSIDEIREYGVNIIGATKGPGSVMQGIQYVQDQKISITKRSVKTIKAYRNYMFDTDKNGKVLNIPDDSNHEWSNSMDCLVEGTLIKTISGDKKIENITRNDLVYTREGIKRVKDAWLVNRTATVMRLKLSDGKELVGTPNHRVSTQTGFKLLTDIRYGDKVYVWNTQYTKEKNTGYAQKAKNITIIMAPVFFIGKFGKIILAKFQKIFMYIIKMALKQIIGLKTLNSCIKEYMVKCTMPQGLQKKKHVIAVKKHSEVKLLGQEIGSVQMPAKVSGEEGLDLMTFQKNANNVEKFSNQTNTVNPCIVLTNVVQVLEEQQKRSVYDITVDECNEYFANNILVHNSIRYGFSRLNQEPIENKKLERLQQNYIDSLQEGTQNKVWKDGYFDKYFPED